MANKLYEIMFQIAGKVQSSFGSSFANAQKQLNNTNRSMHNMSPASNSASKSFSNLGRQIGSLALKVGSLIGAGVGIKEMFSVASDSQGKLAQMDAVLKSTGGAAGMSKQALLNLAAAQGKVTTFSKNTTIAGENLLLTFTGIGKKTFPDTIKAAQDMSTAMGTDLSSSVMTLGKALNDPATGLTKLTKQGVTFTEAQKKQIKAMVAAKNVAGAQAIMLKELKREFGGSAEAAGKTFSGQLTILRNQIKGVGGSIASTLMPHLTNLISKINQNMPKIQATITNIINKVQPYLKRIIEEASKIAANVLPKIKKAIADTVSTVSPYIKPIISDLIKIISNLFPSLGPAAGKAKGPILSLVKGGLSVLKDVLDWFANHGQVTKVAIAGIAGSFVAFNGVNKVVGTISNVKNGLGNFKSALTNVKDGFDTVRIKGLYFQDALKKVGSGGLDGAKSLGKLAINILKTGAGFAKSGIKAAAYAVKLGIQKVATLASAAAEKVLQGAQAALNFVMNMNPISKIIIIIAALVTALVVLYHKNAAFRNFVNAMWAELKTVVGTSIKAIGVFFNSLGQKIEAIGTWIKNTWNNIIAFFQGLPSKFVSIVAKIGTAVIHGFDNAINFIKSLPAKALQWGKDFIEGLVNGIKGKIDSIGDAVKGVAGKIKSFLHFSTPDEGPLKNYAQWPKDFIQGYANGILRNKSIITNAAKSLAKDTSIKFNPGIVKANDVNSPMAKIRNDFTTSKSTVNKNNIVDQPINIVYQITIQGNASKEDIYTGIKKGNDDLEKRINAIKANKQRLSLNQG